MADTEKWRVIKDYPQYEVSSLGNVRRKLRSRPGVTRPVKVSLRSKTCPYLRVCLCDGHGKLVDKNVHVLVCVAFHGVKPSEKHEVAHWDDNKINNRVGNLRWATKSENKFDSIRHGTAKFGLKPGEAHPQAKLTERIVKRMRRDFFIQDIPVGKIAAKYGIGQGDASKIIHGHRWASVTSLSRSNSK